MLAKARGAINALEYRLASLAHWKPREEAVMRALDFVAANDDAGPIRRVIDMGCGPGFLAAAVTSGGLHYVGIDPERAFIDRCRKLGAAGEKIFHVGSVREMPVEIGTDDAFVLNGVAHHLDEADFERALVLARGAGALIVCDHRQSEEGLARWLQAADRGKFVRPFERFERLPGFVCRHSQTFTIGLGPIGLWPYFCLAYTPG